MQYVLALANLGWRAALGADEALARGLNTYDGVVVNEAVATAHGLPVHSPREVLADRAAAV